MPVRTITTLECELTGDSVAIAGELAPDASNLPDGWTLVQLTNVGPNPDYPAARAAFDQTVEQGLAASIEQAKAQGIAFGDEDVARGRRAIEAAVLRDMPLPPEHVKRTILAALSPGQTSPVLKALDNPEWVVQALGDEDDEGEDDTDGDE